MSRPGSSRFFKVGLTLAVIPLLWLAGLSQRQLNRERVALGITRGEPLGSTAPPVLAFTTVALGGLRGLIANALWVRAIELQEADKYFEKVQLADWITKLQPHFVTVWLVQAWDMAYNISIKFQNPRERWQWVRRGITLLRDEALRYNPDETLLYRELAWIFQHKIGQDLDDAHFYFKNAWAREMETLLGTNSNYQALIDPKTDADKARATVLREDYKLDPAHMKAVDDEYGPLEWRLPESHAIYWATYGIKRAKAKDRITLRRAVYQPMQMAFQRGRLFEAQVGTNRTYRFGPNLRMIPQASKAYERMMDEDPEMRSHIANGHKNFLKDAVYFLYTHNRRAEADQWKTYLTTRYPDAMVDDVRKEGSERSRRIADMDVDDYAVARVTEDIGETDYKRVQQAIEGFLANSFFNLALGNTDEAIGYGLLADKVRNRYMASIRDQAKRVGLPPLDDTKREVLERFKENYDPQLVAQLLTRLGLAAGTNAPSAAPAPAATNAPAPAR